ncbi:MAG: alpha/beta fold hydrolase, partial [Candidatus Neomicrothrix subdominans]
MNDQPNATWPLSYDEAGRGGEPLMLVHGFTGGRADFSEWIDPLAAMGRHVVVPDLRGHGTSGGPAGADRYGLDAFAADVLGLADLLGWNRFGLLGHSMGGMVAQ